MVSLVAFISSGKGTWGQVNTLIKSQPWTKVYLVCNEFGYENFEVSNPQKIVKLQFNEKKVEAMPDRLAKFFKSEIRDFEVAVNLSSGTGLEHMALLTGVLKAGLGMRFVYTKQGVFEEFKILEGKLDEDSF